MWNDSAVILARMFFIGVLLVLGITVGVFTLRLVIESRTHFLEAEKLVQSPVGIRSAVIAYEQSARAYMPGNSYSTRSLWKLTILARSAQMRGDGKDALAIWEVVRRSVLSTRHFVQPNETFLLQAEKAIVQLRGPDVKVTKSQLVERPEDPSPLQSIFLFLGLIFWIFGALFICVKKEKWSGFSLNTAALVVSLSGFVLWVLMAWIA